MVIWYAVGAMAAIAIAWLAAVLHIAGRAPIGIISLAVGISLGALLSALAASQWLACRRRLIAGTILLAIVAIVAEHAWLYRDFRRQWHEARAKSPEAALFRPESPWSPREYFTNELTPRRAALWCLDGALIIAATVGTALILNQSRQPFGVAADAKNSLTPDP
jgi:hypothetical protein